MYIYIYIHLSIYLVDPDEIRRLSRRFKRLDLNKNGSLSMDEFMSIPELQQNPLVKRVIDILDTDGNGEVDFQGIIIIMIYYYNHIYLIIKSSLKVCHNLVSKETKIRSSNVSI